MLELSFVVPSEWAFMSNAHLVEKNDEQSGAVVINMEISLKTPNDIELLIKHWSPKDALSKRQDRGE